LAMAAVGIASLLLTVGCVGSDSTTCAWGEVCPPDETCHSPSQTCVLPSQIGACLELADGDSCTYAGAPAEALCLDEVCLAAACGDGHLAVSEQCDDGESNADDTPDACRTNCQMAHCGDGVLDTGESCDDGELNSDTTPGSCRTNCTLMTCGDGALDPGEACDDANTNECDGCVSDCSGPETGCGDGFVCGAEVCDDGNLVDGDGCETSCRNTPTTLASGQSAWNLAVDSTHVYWTNSNGGEVMKVPLGGGTPVVLASGQAGPRDIAVDSTHVYWTNESPGEVMKVPK
jgi:cysteine-rich repeat protein